MFFFFSFFSFLFFFHELPVFLYFYLYHRIATTPSSLPHPTPLLTPLLNSPGLGANEWQLIPRESPLHRQNEAEWKRKLVWRHIQFIARCSTLALQTLYVGRNLAKNTRTPLFCVQNNAYISWAVDLVAFDSNTRLDLEVNLRQLPAERWFR